MGAKTLLDFLGRIFRQRARINLPALLVSMPLQSAVLRCLSILEYFDSRISNELYSAFELSRYPARYAKARKQGGKIEGQDSRGVNLFGYDYDKGKASLP